MQSLIKAIKLIRYLIVWRVNSTFVLLPPAFASEISLVIGSIIANRLATKDAQAWKKIESKWEEFKEKKRVTKGSQTGPWAT